MRRRQTNPTISITEKKRVRLAESVVQTSSALNRHSASAMIEPQTSAYEGSCVMTHKGECFCGAVKVEVSGEPEMMGYCHCRSCRSWSGSLIIGFSMWRPDAVRVTAGAEHLATFQKTEVTEWQYCRKCGDHLMGILPSLGLVDVLVSTLPTLEFVPSVHVNYAERVLSIETDCQS